jgi:hypothetical protein
LHEVIDKEIIAIMTVDNIEKEKRCFTQLLFIVFGELSSKNTNF